MSQELLLATQRMSRLSYLLWSNIQKIQLPRKVPIGHYYLSAGNPYKINRRAEQGLRRGRHQATFFYIYLLVTTKKGKCGKLILGGGSNSLLLQSNGNLIYCIYCSCLVKILRQKNTKIGINDAFSVKILDNNRRQNFNQTETFCRKS